jgi:hypothetical protein
MGKVTYLLTDVPPYSRAKSFENDSVADLSAVTVAGLSAGIVAGLSAGIVAGLSAGIVAGLIGAPFFRYINEL